MSIKRGKQVSRGAQGRHSDDAPGWLTPRPAERKWDWAADASGQPDESFVPYAMTATFTVGALVQHAKFGKGVVTLIDGPNIDVLFEDGSKRLRHTPAAK
jgi:hypothetical protein